MTLALADTRAGTRTGVFQLREEAVPIDCIWKC